ncbi:Mu transposase C-terminal domain-containing protein [Gaoshiqia sp. Z1-71]|uniref:Mu transposase C-terminal domain-containing protein n=1 Tax=Gaoshiqia hydrogeniformans TaxID=3290090 RepID=UPI003BF84D55
MIQSGAHIPSRLLASPTQQNSQATNGISDLLCAAMEGHNRHFDLFGSSYYRNNPEKRELSAKRYALLKCCHKLTSSGNYSIKEVFEAYNDFKEASIHNYQSFTRKLKEFEAEGAASCQHKRINQQYKDRYKLNPYVEFLVYNYLCDPAYHSYNSIKKWVNLSIVEFNQKHGSFFNTISKSTVAQYYLDNSNEINYFRKGKQRFDKETRPYFPRITALNAGSLYQMDGTPIQIFCWNHESKWKTEGKRKIRLNLFAIRDAYSGKITGFDLSETEDRFNIIEALKMSVNTHGHLPAELVHDNFSASSTDEFKAIKEFMENKGVVVRAAKVGNAQDKGEVERFFGTFQSRFQRLIDGYIGEGIRSKRENGRISEEFITRFNKENGLYGYDEMMKIIAELVAIYNNSEINEKYGDSTPNQLYAQSEKPYTKQVDNLDYVQMFWLPKEVTVRKSMIINEVRKSKRFYEIWDNDLKLRLNGQKVRIFYDSDDASDIHVFTLDGDFVCTCSQHPQIHEAFVDQQEGEKERMMKHVAHRESIYKAVETKSVERLKRAETLIGSGIELLAPITMEKRKLNDAESQALLKHFYDHKGIDPEAQPDREPARATIQARELREKAERKKPKGVHTTAATYKTI